MTLILELFNGVAFGIEHVSGDEEDDFSWMVAVHFLCLRLCLYKFPNEQTKRKPAGLNILAGFFASQVPWN